LHDHLGLVAEVFPPCLDAPVECLFVQVEVKLDLVNVQKVFSKYAERLEEDSWYIELDRWQDVFHREANYHASADTLTVAVRLPLLRRGSRGYDLYKLTFFPIMQCSHLYDIRTEEKIFAWDCGRNPADSSDWF
jgi:hypothetical protein